MGFFKLFGNGLSVSQQAVCFLDCGSTGLQFGFFCFVELNFYDAFNSIFPEYNGNSNTQVLQSVFALRSFFRRGLPVCKNRKPFPKRNKSYLTNRFVWMPCEFMSCTVYSPDGHVEMSTGEPDVYSLSSRRLPLGS